MKESRFIEQNKKKWSAFNSAFANRQKDPGALSKLFVQITDDLSFSRTFYPNRSIRKYLNGLAERLFISLNSTRKERFSDFVYFWKTSLPLMNFRARKEFFVSFIVFSLAFLIGFVSSSNDSTFASFILGEDYIEQTLENINNDDPMAIYKKFIPIEGFLSITLNNLLVATYTFVLGAFSAIGTLFILLYNGVMVGAFQEYFVGQGLSKVSFLTIWQHGTIEISSIIIAGAAGLTLGKGMLFPGTYTRFQSFRIGARRGLKMFMGIFPAIILAGFIESFITRHTEWPDVVRIGVILLSLFLMLWYYVWYPRSVAHKQGPGNIKESNIDFIEKPDVDLKRIYTKNQLFENTLIFMRTRFGKFIRVILLLSILGSISSVFIVSQMTELSNNIWLDPDKVYWPAFLSYENLPILYVLNSFGLAVIIFAAMKPLSGLKLDSLPGKKYIPNLRLGLMGLIMSMIVNGFFFLGFWVPFLILVLLFPMLMMVSFVFVNQKVNYFASFGAGFKYYFDNFMSGLELSFKFGALQVVFLILMNNVIFRLLDYLMVFVDIPYDHYYFYLAVLQGILFFFVLFFGIGLIIVSIGLLYFSSYESQTAENLFKRIDAFGETKKILGYERE